MKSAILGTVGIESGKKSTRNAQNIESWIAGSWMCWRYSTSFSDIILGTEEVTNHPSTSSTVETAIFGTVDIESEKESLVQHSNNITHSVHVLLNECQAVQTSVVV